MGSVGGDAAFVLEKALEEMDSIFKEAKQPVLHAQQRSADTAITNNIRELVENFEKYLVDTSFPSGLDPQEVNNLYQYTSKLSYFMLFIEDLVDHLHGTKHEDLVKELETVKKEKEAFLLQVGRLSTDLEHSQKELLQVKVTKEELAKEIQSMKIAQSENIQGISEEQDSDLDSVKSQRVTSPDESEKRSRDDNNVGLKKRLREKASEVNRLKLIVNDLKSSHEEKDDAISRVQVQIEQLREENEVLRQANTALQSNLATVAATNHSHSNGNSYSRSEVDPDTENSFQVDRTNSEPNLVRNHARNERSPPNVSAMPIPHVNGRAFPPEGRRNVIGNSFATWTMEQISEWLEDEGLSAYIPAFSRTLSKGDDVFKFTAVEMEREIGITLSIHQKKLQYALKALQSADADYTGRLDHNWVARWLDDIGLPQYKGIFYESRVDGRVLQNLTLDDLLHLKVYTTLHHVSLKRAIQCLRHQRFHPNYLKPSLTPQNEDRCNHVMLWTNGRVMDWLRSVDLAEYAPNLRGSGVHGALMILEPRFNADTLANLLSIPQNKTLLRRHLVSQFDTLLSENCQKQKEMTSLSPDFTPLNASEKHKLRKRGLPFGTLRRRKSELELDQCVCPMDLEVPLSISPPPSLDPDDVFEFSDTLSSPAVSNEQDSSVENGSSQVKMVGEFSQELNTLTTMLNQR